jgi:hypothetical protein
MNPTRGNSSSAAINQVLINQIAKTQPLIQLTNQNQTVVRSDPRTLEIDLQGGVEGKLKRLVYFFTHWVLTSSASSLLPNPYE